MNYAETGAILSARFSSFRPAKTKAQRIRTGTNVMADKRLGSVFQINDSTWRVNFVLPGCGQPHTRLQRRITGYQPEEGWGLSCEGITRDVPSLPTNLVMSQVSFVMLVTSPRRSTGPRWSWLTSFARGIISFTRPCVKCLDADFQPYTYIYILIRIHFGFFC